jgi:NAD+ diphosphatase
MNITRDTGPVFLPSFGPATRRSDEIILGFIGDDLLVTTADKLPASSMLESLGAPQNTLEIGWAGDTGYELRVWPALTEIPGNLLKADLRKLSGIWPKPLLGAVSRARQLAVWLHENQFCGVCGGRMETELLTPARKCGACGFISYPRVSPVCIVLVSRGDEILLARSPHFRPGIYSALAGYVEAGESAEECARREVREEAGIEIRNLRWFGSQSWPFPHSLMLGFFADYAGGELVLQQSEIEDAQWFRRDNLPTLPHSSTIACRMIQSWLAQDE